MAPDVCHHSGLPRETCDYSCVHCASQYRPTPDLAEIRKSAAALREAWPANKLRHQEGHGDELEIPTASRPGTGLVDRREYLD